MLDDSSHARGHHYLPKMLLKNFSFDCSRKNPPVHVYDKSRSTSFTTGIENICQQRDFYTLKNDGVRVSIEENFSRLETAAAVLINEIVRPKSIKHLDSEARALLILFTAAQQARGVGSRSIVSQLGEALRSRLRENGCNSKVMLNLASVNEKEHIKRQAIVSLPSGIRRLVRLYEKKDMILFVDHSASLIIGDEPVVMDNHKKLGAFGNGLAVKGVEVYFPLSSCCVISFMCKSLQADRVENLSAFENEKEACEQGRGRLPMSFFSQQNEAYKTDKALAAQIDRGEPIDLDLQGVIYLNSLQVINSERYIISCDGDFSLVKDMIKDNERFRTGRKIIVG